MAKKETVVLYRPVGNAELALLRERKFRRWPPRLPAQPIFYPVTNEQYAAEIAKRWNAKDGEDGYVTKFEVKKAFMDNFDVQQVGASHHMEWWIPAEKMEELNDNIIGEIQVVAEYSS